MNKRGTPKNLVARHPGNTNSLKAGVYSERVQLERAKARLQELRQLPHSLPDGHPLLDAIARQQVVLDLIDEDLAQRGPTDRHGGVRSILDLRIRAVARLEKLLEKAELTPEAQRRTQSEAGRRAFAAEIARLENAKGNSDPVDGALKKIVFHPETTVSEKLRALQILSDRAHRDAQYQLRENELSLRARGFL